MFVLQKVIGSLLRKENPAPLIQRLGAIPTTPGMLTRLVCARVQAVGIELGPLLKKAGLTKQQVEDVRARIGVPCQIRFLNLAASALQDEFLGFHAGQLFELRHLGLGYYVAASSETLGEALRRGARYFSMVNESVSVKCLEEKDISIVFNYIGVARQLDRHQIEFWFTAMVRLVTELTGRPVKPSRVRLVHRRAGNLSEFAEFFCSDIEFGATVDELTFPARSAELPVVGADPHLNELLMRNFEQAVSHGQVKRGSFRSAVENAIVQLLPHGSPRASEIARRCGVSRRTLVRRLRSEGLAFSEVLNDLRRDLATQYLADPGWSISHIAWLLGYREVSAFTNAFRKRIGKSPRKMRLQLLHA